jgi:hypothetical protein
MWNSEYIFNFAFQIRLKYIFPAGGLLKSTLNTFVKIRLRKVKLKNPDSCSIIRGILQGFFRFNDSFPLRGDFRIHATFFRGIID